MSEPGINVTMPLDTFERIKHESMATNIARGQTQGEAGIIRFLTAVAMKQIPASDVDYSQLPPSLQLQTKLIIKMIDTALVAEQMQKDALLKLPAVQAQLIKIQSMSLEDLTEWLQQNGADTLDESIVYDRAVARESFLRKELNGKA